MSFFEKHQDVISKAVDALHARTFFAAFPEQPSPAIYGETADAEGQASFKSAMGKKFESLRQEDAIDWVGEEESPYSRERLGVLYPVLTSDTLISRSHRAANPWSRLSASERAGMLTESLMRIKRRFFEIAYATMHTTGQGFMMAFQASGPHAADRALEAIAAGYEELHRFPANALWSKPMGKYSIQLNKEWRAVPKGISLVIGCSTFPTWNSVTGIYGSLITGNPVIVKPHPGAVLPIAIVVEEIRNVFRENEIDPDTCQLAVDTYAHPLARELALHPDVRLIDFTGNSEFGNYLESLPGKIVFTEKTGVNSVILDSVEDIDKVAANLAFSVNLYSGQMCTAPQNFYIPDEGIKSLSGIVTLDQFAQKLVDQINGLIDNPKAGPFVLGAIQNQKTVDRVLEAEKIPGKIWLKSRTFQNPAFQQARVTTPVVVEINAGQLSIAEKELFGPIILLIRTRDTDESITLARNNAARFGAITCGAYTTNPAVREKIADTMASVATPVSFNLTGGIYMNQHAAFSDFHVTGGNPAGNASFTDPGYVTKRFTWVGHREPAPV